jgi:hypothetical protein
VRVTGPEITTNPGPGGLGVPVVAAHVGGNPIEILESHSTRWLFDRARRRLLRLPRDLELDVSVLAMPWQSYTAVRLDDHDSGVVVTLAGGGLLRLHVHRSGSAAP